MAHTLTVALNGIGTYPNSVVWDTNVSSNYYYNSLWLPPYDETSAATGFNGLVPIENVPSPANNPPFPGAGADFAVDTGSGDMQAEVVVDFYLYFAGRDIYAARLTRPNASDWYRSLKPWQFGVHRPGGTQKGGVEIYKNVINPTQGDITKIHYVLPKDGHVTIQVFNLAGDIVDVLFRGSQAAGQHSVYWDGRNRGTRVVARGLYFIKVVGPGIDETRKVLVVK
jgi:hypothetical protein